MVQALTLAENSNGIRDSNGERMSASPGSEDRGMVEEMTVLVPGDFHAEETLAAMFKAL